MTCFLRVFSAGLFSTILLLFFVGSSAIAQSLPEGFSPFNYTNKAWIIKTRGGEREYHTEDHFSALYNLIPENGNNSSFTRQQFYNSFSIALEEGTWGVVQNEIKSSSGDYGQYTLFWTHAKSDYCDFKLFRLASGSYAIGSFSPNASDFRCKINYASYHIDVRTGVFWKQQSNYQIVSNSESSSKMSVLLFAGDYTLHESMKGYDPKIVDSLKVKTDVKFPLNIYSVADKNKRTAEVNAALDTHLFKKLNPDVPYPSMYAVELYNVNKEKIPGTVKVLGSSVERWIDVPYGEYRVLFVGYYTGDDFERYNALPSVVDIRVTEYGFHYTYNSDNDSFCFFKNGISSADLTLFSVDPNTGSWLSPGASPERCIDEKPWQKDVNSEISAGYNLEEIPQCDTFDLVCHFSRLLSTITGWISSFFRWLFIPDTTFIQTMFTSFLNNLQNSLGFLWTPVTIIQTTYNGIINNQISGDTCALPSMSMFGKPATVQLCAWRYQLPQLWQYMQLAIQGGLAIGLIWAIYRSVMRFFGVTVDDDDESDDGGFEEVRWHDERTGDTGTWERRSKR